MPRNHQITKVHKMLYGVVFLIFLVSCVGCNKKHKGEPKEENLDEFAGYVFTDKSAYVINLKKNTLLREIRLPEKIRSVFSTDTSIVLAGNFLWEMIDEKFYPASQTTGWKLVTRLPADYKALAKEVAPLTDEEQVYILKKDKLIVFRQEETPDGTEREIVLSDPSIKFFVGFEKIWLLDESGFSVYNIADLKEECRIPVEKPSDFVLSHYGIRLYIASRQAGSPGSGTIDVYDAKTFKQITTISIKDTINMVKYLSRPGGIDKLYCLGKTGIYQINRATNKIEQIIRIDGGKDLFFSSDGAYGIVTLDSTIAFFNTGTDKISKNLGFKAISLASTPMGTRIYCLTEGGLITILPEDFESASRIRLSNGKEVIIIKKHHIQSTSVSDKYAFAIQFNTGKDSDSAKYFVETLGQAYYPAWIFEDEEGYNVRIGLFASKEDAEIFKNCRDIARYVPTDKILNIVKVPYVSKEFNMIGVRDLNQDSCLDEAVQLEGKTLIIFEFQNGVYRKIYSTTKDTIVYADGQPEFKEVEGKLVVKTPLLNGGFSIIEFKDSEFIERYEH